MHAPRLRRPLSVPPRRPRAPAGWPARALGCLLALALTAGAPAHAAVAAGRQALARGEWSAAEREFRAAPAAERGAALLGLAELCLLTGRYPEAEQHARQAAALPATKARALCLQGEAARATGRSAEAIRCFRAAVAAAPSDRLARLHLARTLQAIGKTEEAERLFGTFFDEYNAAADAGKLQNWNAEALTCTAIAARYLQAWQDANGTFQDAVEKDPSYLPAHLEWGELFLMKYRADEAIRSFAEVLKRNPRHPQALVGMARARLEASYDVTRAAALADEALRSNPKCVPALALKARLALDDEAFAPAETLLRQALAVNPADLEALALLGASRYLQGDTLGYEEARRKALAENPKYGDFFFLVGELAVRHHRYEEAVALNREALRVEPKNANALAALGTNLLRLGLAHEEEGLKFLAQAFEIDAFNVRTFNTLNLYEEVIARDYTTIRGSIFNWRLNRKEAPLLVRHAVPLLERAWSRFIEKYGFTPRHPITVELFTERQHYGARTIGLPELGAQGTCFGMLITAMSPSSAEASWEEVLWHELAHVFHLQLSKNRVPRWFTEGLAEYETNLERPYWKREHGREIYLSLKRGDLWKFSELSAAFTRPNRPNGVLLAYQQSALAIRYLAERFGFPKLVDALKLYGEGKRDAEVLPAITGQSVEALDRGFREYLAERYAVYGRGFLFDPEEFSEGAKLKAAAEAAPMDAAAQARLAAALLVRVPESPALAEQWTAVAAQAKKALALDEKQPLARFVLARALLRSGDVPGARKELETLLGHGTDGFEIRMDLARIAAAEQDVETAARHAAEAKRWDPDSTSPYALMIRLYEEKDRREELLKETEAYLDLQEHDHAAARLLFDRLAADRRWADLARVAPRVLGTTPMEPFVHQQYGMALAELGRPKEAAFHLESALLGGLERPGPTRALLARQWLLAGEKTRAKEEAERALREDPSNAEAQEVLKQASGG